MSIALAICSLKVNIYVLETHIQHLPITQNHITIESATSGAISPLHQDKPDWVIMQIIVCSKVLLSQSVSFFFAALTPIIRVLINLQPKLAIVHCIKLGAKEINWCTVAWHCSLYIMVRIKIKILILTWKEYYKWKFMNFEL